MAFLSNRNLAEIDVFRRLDEELHTALLHFGAVSALELLGRGCEKESGGVKSAFSFVKLDLSL